MKLADRTVEIHSSGVDSKNQFSIAQTSKMFKILSDSLYSDKIMAVIRELSTNAYDSHIASGNKNPFKVSLPTQAVPSFVVRDYGTGLSQADMENLYTTYGASNKNDSNDFVGCLGLGSKSPFAYTKSFTTTSYYNGKAYSYIAAMDDNGVPSLNLFKVFDTKEQNGLEISFAVKQNDFNEFTAKAKRVFHYFRMKPIIEGGVCPSISDGSYSHNNTVIEGKGWKICRFSTDWTKYPSQHNSPGSGIVAIMGNIAYPVDANKIVGEDRPDQPDHIQAWNRAFRKADVDNWKSLVREILHAGLYLEIQFGIGELEMDVSREGLQYTKQVIKALREKTQDIYLELKEDMSNKLTEATSLVEAYETYYNLSELAGGWTAGASWTDPDGKVHDLVSGKDLEYTFKKSKQLYAINFRSAGYRSRRLVYLTDKIHYETLSGKGSYYWDNSHRKTGKVAFFRCDVKGLETAKKIVVKYCNQNNCFAYLMADSDHPEDSTDGFDDIIKHIGGESKVLLVSNFKSLIQQNRSGVTSKGSLGSVSKDSLFLLIGNLSSAESITSDMVMNDSSYLKVISDEEERDGVLDQDEIVYIPIMRYASVSGYPSLSEIWNLYSDEKFHGPTMKEIIGDTNIYAIKSSYANELMSKGYKLVDFNKFFKSRVKKFYDEKIKELSKYNGLIEYAKNEYGKSENSGYYYGSSIDKRFLFHVLNLFGLEYKKHIQNDDLVNLIDQCMVYEFMSETIHRSTFDIKRFKSIDYFAHMTQILSDIGLNGLDSNNIRKANTSYASITSCINRLYDKIESESLIKNIKNDTSLNDKLPKIVDLRKDIKTALDNQPVLKYIVCTQDERCDIRSLTSASPISDMNRPYYGRQDSWSSKIDNIELFRELISKCLA